MGWAIRVKNILKLWFCEPGSKKTKSETWRKWATKNIKSLLSSGLPQQWHLAGWLWQRPRSTMWIPKCATSSTVPTGLDSLDWISESWYNSEPTIFIYETQGWRFHLRSIPNGWRFIVGLSGNWSRRVSHYITSYCCTFCKALKGLKQLCSTLHARHMSLKPGSVQLCHTPNLE